MEQIFGYDLLRFLRPLFLFLVLLSFLIFRSSLFVQAELITATTRLRTQSQQLDVQE